MLNTKQISLSRMNVLFNTPSPLLKCFLSIGFCFFAFFSHAQLDSIYNLPDKEQRLFAFTKWANKNIFWQVKEKRDPEKKLSLLHNLYEKVKNENDEKLEREIIFNKMLCKIGGIIEPINREEALTQMLAYAESMKKEGWRYTEAQSRMVASTILFDNGKYGPSFEQAGIAYDIFKNLSLEKYPESNIYIAEMATRFYYFAQYDTAIHLLKEATNVAPPWNNMPKLYSVLNTLALCYMKTEKYDSAIHYFKKAYDEALLQKHEVWEGIITGNMGLLYYKTHEYQLALPALLAGVQISKNLNNSLGLPNASVALAGIYFSYGDMAKTQKYIDLSREHFSDLDANRLTDFYYILSKYEEQKKNHKLAYIYLDSSHFYKEKLYKEQHTNIFDRNRQMMEAEKYISRIKLLESEKNSHELTKKGMIALLILTCIITVLWISRVRAKKNIALKTAALEKIQVSEQLYRSQHELRSFTAVLREKNELIEKLKADIIEAHPHHTEDERMAALAQLNQAIILTEEDWNKFRDLFNKVYPGFFIRLKERMPELTASDIRVLALTRLNLSQKEMASMLGIGYDAIRKARQRLRHKVNLEKDESIEELAKMI